MPTSTGPAVGRRRRRFSSRRRAPCSSVTSPRGARVAGTPASSSAQKQCIRAAAARASARSSRTRSAARASRRRAAGARARSRRARARAARATMPASRDQAGRVAELVGDRDAHTANSEPGVRWRSAHAARRARRRVAVHGAARAAGGRPGQRAAGVGLRARHGEREQLAVDGDDRVAPRAGASGRLEGERERARACAPTRRQRRAARAARARRRAGRARAAHAARGRRGVRGQLVARAAASASHAPAAGSVRPLARAGARPRPRPSRRPQLRLASATNGRAQLRRHRGRSCSRRRTRQRRARPAGRSSCMASLAIACGQRARRVVRGARPRSSASGPPVVALDADVPRARRQASRSRCPASPLKTAVAALSVVSRRRAG